MVPFIFGTQAWLFNGDGRRESIKGSVERCSCARLTFKPISVEKYESFQHVSSTESSIESLHSGDCQREVAGLEDHRGPGLAAMPCHRPFRVSVATNGSTATKHIYNLSCPSPWALGPWPFGSTTFSVNSSI